MSPQSVKLPIPNRTAPLTEVVVDPLRKLLLEVGDVAAGKQLGVARHTITRAAAGLPVRPSVATTIAWRLGFEVA